MTTVRLALNGPPLLEKNGSLKGEALPAVLVSYMYLKTFLPRISTIRFRNWVLDSGAFTAHASGKPIDVQAYIEKAQELLASPSPPVEVFSLDVVGDWKASAANTDKLWEAGVQVIPAFHVGSPESELLRLAQTYPKIALGGAVGYRHRLAWATQCFARVWPKKIHGFGFGDARSIMQLPWHSVDASSWELGPCAFGNWKTYGKMSVRGTKQDLRGEIDYYLDLEKRAATRWSAQLAEIPNAGTPTVRLALASTRFSRT